MNQTPATLGEDRHTFMARIREALTPPPEAVPRETDPVAGSDCVTPGDPSEGQPQTSSARGTASGGGGGVDEGVFRLVSGDEDVVGIFAQRAEDVGMVVHRVRGGAAAAQVEDVLAQLGARRVVVGAGETGGAGGAGGAGEAIGLAGALGRAGVEVVDWQTLGPDGLYDCDAGITDVHAALAETGTLICNSDASHARALSLVPDHHIALVRASDILPDMIDYWARLAGLPGPELPSSQSLITGPSKTADIEGILVTGVHGPCQVHIILIEDA